MASQPTILGFSNWLAERVLEQSCGYATPCWIWRLSTSPTGYARTKVPGCRNRTVGVHRLAYETLIGPIAEGLEIDHLCRNRSCVNPAHLEPVTHAENMRRFTWKRTICLHGHPLEGDNIKVFADGRRTCRTCNTAWFRARDARRRAAA